MAAQVYAVLHALETGFIDGDERDFWIDFLLALLLHAVARLMFSVERVEEECSLP